MQSHLVIIFPWAPSLHKAGVNYFALGLLARSITSYGVSSKVPAGDYLENNLSALDLPSVLLISVRPPCSRPIFPIPMAILKGFLSLGFPADEFSGFLFLEEAP